MRQELFVLHRPRARAAAAAPGCCRVSLRTTFRRAVTYLPVQSVPPPGRSCSEGRSLPAAVRLSAWVLFSVTYLAFWCRRSRS